jgi:hypothetical protein
MAETPYAETEALLMVLRGDDVGDVQAYLRGNFNARELGKLLESLVRLQRTVLRVYQETSLEVASPGEG